MRAPNFVHAYVLFGSSEESSGALRCALKDLQRKMQRRGRSNGRASSFIIPVRLCNAWEILTVITVASQGFLPFSSSPPLSPLYPGFRDSANYGNGMDLQCLIYYFGLEGIKAFIGKLLAHKTKWRHRHRQRFHYSQE